MADIDRAVKEIMGAGASVGDPAVISTLERALSLARQGKVSGVAVVLSLGGERCDIAMSGQGLAAMSSGIAQAHRMLLDQLFAPAARGHALLMPGRG